MNAAQIIHRAGRMLAGALGGVGVLALGAWLGGATHPARAGGGLGQRMPRATEEQSAAYPNKSKHPPLAPNGRRPKDDPTADTGGEIPLGDVLAVNGQPMQLSIFTTRDTPEQVIAYYCDAFEKRGLKPLSSADPLQGHVSVFSPADGMQRFINALPQADGQTMVMVGITDPRKVPNLIDSAKTAPFPVPEQNRGFLSYASEDAGMRAQSGQYVTSLPAAEVLAYYRKELGTAGFHEQPGGRAAMVSFDHGNVNITVAIQPLDQKAGAAVFVNRTEGQLP